MWLVLRDQRVAAGFESIESELIASFTKQCESVRWRRAVQWQVTGETGWTGLPALRQGGTVTFLAP